MVATNAISFNLEYSYDYEINELHNQASSSAQDQRKLPPTTELQYTVYVSRV